VELAAGAPAGRQAQLPYAPGPPQGGTPAVDGGTTPLQSGVPGGIAASCAAPAAGQAAPVSYAIGIACAVYVGIANGSFLVGGQFHTKRPLCL
jgi:hypothetical protein